MINIIILLISIINLSINIEIIWLFIRYIKLLFVCIIIKY